MVWDANTHMIPGCYVLPLPANCSVRTISWAGHVHQQVTFIMSDDSMLCSAFGATD